MSPLVATAPLPQAQRPGQGLSSPAPPSATGRAQEEAGRRLGASGEGAAPWPVPDFPSARAASPASTAPKPQTPPQASAAQIQQRVRKPFSTSPSPPALSQTRAGSAPPGVLPETCAKKASTIRDVLVAVAGRELGSSRIQGWLFHGFKAGSPPFSRVTNAWSPGVSFQPNTMASPTSFPASGSRSKKPLGRMAGWLRQALSKKSKKMPVSQEGPGSDALPGCSQDNALPQSSQDDRPPRCPQNHSPSSGLSSAALAESPALPPAQEGATSSSSNSGRWSRDYDVCVCHSEEDLAAAQELVAYLEDCSASLRCFLQLRDAAPGSAIVSELCRALDSSHCQVLLITPGFQRDPWCRYQMLQALSQAPGAEGRTIPLLAGLARDAYPPELRFMYFVDGRGPERGFRQVKEAILRYLQTLR